MPTKTDRKSQAQGTAADLEPASFAQFRQTDAPVASGRLGLSFCPISRKEHYCIVLKELATKSYHLFLCFLRSSFAGKSACGLRSIRFFVFVFVWFDRKRKEITQLTRNNNNNGTSTFNPRPPRPQLNM